jgi:hypothetical protein
MYLYDTGLAGTVLRDRFESDQSYRRDNTVPLLPSHKSQAYGAVLYRPHYYPYDTTVADQASTSIRNVPNYLVAAKHSHLLGEALETSMYGEAATSCLT